MSLSATLSLKNEAASAKSFVTTNVTNNKVDRLDGATSLSLPTRLVINHQTSGSGATLTDRHLIQASRTELDAANVPYTTVVNLTIAMPRRSVSTASALDLVSFIKDLIDTGGVASADLASILQGQS